MDGRAATAHDMFFFSPRIHLYLINRICATDLIMAMYFTHLLVRVASGEALSVPSGVNVYLIKMPAQQGPCWQVNYPTSAPACAAH